MDLADRPLLALLAALTTVAAVPGASRSATIDKGSFKIYANDRALGAETFELVEAQDSLVVRVRQYLTLPTSRGEEALQKGVDLYVSQSDYALRQYQSTKTFRGATTVRAVVVADTHYVAYREGQGIGEGESRVLPPGRVYVMDSQVITLFDLICRGLHGTSFESRSFNLLALGPRDTMLEARAVSLGSETLRWGARRLIARKYQIVADSQTTIMLWAGPQGQLLRLIEPTGGLRAERDPPPVKRRSPPPPKPGG